MFRTVMGMKGSHDPRLAIRTIVVTTRAAATTNLNQGWADQARESVRRGLTLLEPMRGSGQNGTEEAVQEAIGELQELEASVSDQARH